MRLGKERSGDFVRRRSETECGGERTTKEMDVEAEDCASVTEDFGARSAQECEEVSCF